MHSSDGLQFLGRIEDRFDEKDMRCFDQIQTLGAGRKGQQQARDIQIWILYQLPK